MGEIILTNKYRNQKVIVDNIKFDSKLEANRYQELKLLEKANLISDLKLQHEFILQDDFIINKHKRRKISYIADFYYYDKKLQQYVVEDTKGFKTNEYRIKKKLFEYKYQTEIVEIKK